jgi:hypothetical protein
VVKVVGDDNVVSDRDARDAIAGLYNVANTLMSKNIRVLIWGESSIGKEVRPAYTSGGQLNNGISGSFKLRDRNVLDGNIIWTCQ